MKRSLVSILVVTALVFSFLWVRKSAQNDESVVPEVIVVGTTADYAPMAFKQDSEIVGFDIDVVKELVQRLGKKMVIVDMPFEVLLPQLQLGKIHLIAAGMSATPERAQRVSFTQPYLSEDPLVVVTLKKNAPVSSLNDLMGKTVIVNQGYTADSYLSKMNGMTVTRLGSVSDALLALRAGRGDAFVTSMNSFKPALAQYDAEEFSLFTLPDTDENTAFALAKNNDFFLQAVDEVLSAMRNDGTIDSLKQKWHVT